MFGRSESVSSFDRPVGRFGKSLPIRVVEDVAQDDKGPGRSLWPFKKGIAVGAFVGLAERIHPDPGTGRAFTEVIAADNSAMAGYARDPVEKTQKPIRFML